MFANSLNIVQVRIAQTGFFIQQQYQPYVTTINDLLKNIQKKHPQILLIKPRVFTKGGVHKNKQCLIEQKPKQNNIDDSQDINNESENSVIGKDKNNKNALKQMTYVCHNNSNQNSNLKQARCFYIFSGQIINKSEQTIQITQRQILENLQKKIEQFKTLKTQVYQLQLPKTPILQQLKSKTPSIFQFLVKFNEKYTSFSNFKEHIKIISNQIESWSQKCRNQYKSFGILSHCIDHNNKDIEKKLSGLKNQTLKIRNEMENGRSNKPSARRGVIQNNSKILDQISKKNINIAINLQKKMQNLQQKFRQHKTSSLKMKQNFKIVVKQYHECLIKINEKVFTNKQKIQEIFIQIQEKYSAWKEQAFLLLQNQSNQKNIIQKFFEQIQEKYQENIIIQNQILINNMILQQKQTYRNIFQVNKKLKSIVCDFFCTFNKLKQSNAQLKAQTRQVQQAMQRFVKDLQIINSEQNKEAIYLEYIQCQRRIKFNKQLTSLYKKLSNLIQIQSQIRKKYKQSLNKIKKSQNQYIIKSQYFELLEIEDVPSIEIDYKNSTDKQIVQIFAIQQPTDQQSAQFLSNQHYKLNEDKILKQLQNYSNKIKKCVFQKQRDIYVPQQQKIKNLVQLLQSSSKIYYDLYSNKLEKQQIKIKNLQKQNKKYKQEMQNFKNKFNILQKQFENKQDKYQKDLQKINTKNQDLKTQNLQLIKQIQKLNQLSLNSSNNNSSNIQQINSLYKKIHSLQNQNMTYVEKLKKQLLLTQKLSDGYGLIELQNLDLKQQLAKRHIQIIKLQKQLDALKLSYSIVINQSSSKIKNNKQVLQNQYQHKLNNCQQKAKNQEKDSYIDELKQQIQRLNNRTQQLEETINQMVNDFKDTQDQQIQVSFGKDNHTQVLNAISQTDLDNSMMQSTLISNQLSLNSVKQGNHCVFLPFDKTTYIAICLPQNSQYEYANTHYLNNLNNQNNQQRDHFYVLDMKHLPQKAQTLLTQCSLIIVAKVQKIITKFQQGCSFVEGKIEYAIGFEDDDRQLKNYSHLLYE